MALLVQELAGRSQTDQEKGVNKMLRGSRFEENCGKQTPCKLMMASENTAARTVVYEACQEAAAKRKDVSGPPGDW